ncbi:MAG TPA: epoxyqueuosine reductase [Methanoregulaceae archaeon]|nr:epoxyqueuosine reductase [Methanoregulaceae archaeon]
MEHPLKQAIRAKCRELDIALVGFASAGRWDEPLFEPWVPEQFRPGSILPGTETVIVIGLPVFLPVIETAPSIYYHELYKTVNGLLDSNAYRISLYLNREGYFSVPIPRDGYGSLGILKDQPCAFFSHRHAAFLAGLGTFGINNTVLTREFGPRVRFASIFTDAAIPPDPLITGQLCNRCMQCIDICPVHALQGNDYPDGITDKARCIARSEALAKNHSSPCGFCIKVCPVGNDRELYNRKNPDIYDENNKNFEKIHRAWRHVRSYGSKKE